jgi:hypothetical protein
VVHETTNFPRFCVILLSLPFCGSTLSRAVNKRNLNCFASLQLLSSRPLGEQVAFTVIEYSVLYVHNPPLSSSMGSTYSESRRPSRDTIRSGYIDDDINIPHRSMLQAARRRQETKALLASPGPLESMLKTTTETGDIGVYSIRPTRSFSRAQPPLHPAITSSGTILTRSMSVNARDRRHARDDRRGPLVHRNATSEIVSLYDSTGQRSMHGPFSRSLDDGGPRSYSLTSCSSRYMSDQKSTGTWDSRSSGGSGGSGGLMPRPRSPYPYHTRLKRPGIRPSSPALTQDGTIDYSQMVEVNRPSYVS